MSGTSCISGVTETHEPISDYEVLPYDTQNFTYIEIELKVLYSIFLCIYKEIVVNDPVIKY